MGRFFSVVSMMAFVLMMVAVPMIAVFGLPEINPPFKELGDKLKETAMNKIRGSIVMEQDRVDDPNSPLYGLAPGSQGLTEAETWGDPRYNNLNQQLPNSPVIMGNVQPANYQQPDQKLDVNQALYQQENSRLGRLQPDQPEHPPLMKSLLAEQSLQMPKHEGNGVVNTAFSRSVPSRQPETMNHAQEQRTPLTFMQATKILQEMGIKEYSLEPGVRPDQFYFVCLYTAVDNQSVTTRFEAEANDPMVAVENVLLQIKQTLQQKPSALNQTNYNQSRNTSLK